MDATSTNPERPPSKAPLVRDDAAYILPMAVFLAFTWAATQWKDGYAWLYGAKTVVTAVSLFVCWKAYTTIRWNAWWLGLIVGAVGAVQWIGMQLFLQKHFTVFHPPEEVFNPLAFFGSAISRDVFIALRLTGAVLVVPVMEELFWRDFLWRSVLAPNDFKLAEVGEWALAPFFTVAAAFATVHGNWWLTAIVWAFLIGALLAYTKSLGACIIAHATTNLLLAVYVLVYHDWAFW